MKTAILCLALFTVSAGVGCSKSEGSIGSGGGDSSAATSGSSDTSGSASGGSSGSSLSVGSGSLSTSSSTGSGQGCDGMDLQGCACSQNAATRACYSGNPSQAGVGACAMGTQTCTSSTMGEFTSGTWGPCQGSVSPMPEVCGDGIDNDCNGQVDDGCMACVPGTTQSCQGNGTETCDASGQWGPCVPPATCTEGTTQNCNTPNGPGTQQCVGGNWTPCSVPSSTGMTGDPCTPGTGAQAGPNDPGCAGFAGCGETLYCDSSAHWQCFCNSGCTQAACESCMEMNCPDALQPTGDPTCDDAVQTLWNFLSQCGPDRTAYFSMLEGTCAQAEAVYECKNQCISGSSGPCNLY